MNLDDFLVSESLIPWNEAGDLTSSSENNTDASVRVGPSTEDLIEEMGQSPGEPRENFIDESCCDLSNIKKKVLSFKDNMPISSSPINYDVWNIDNCGKQLLNNESSDCHISSSTTSTNNVSTTDKNSLQTNKSPLNLFQSPILYSDSDSEAINLSLQKDTPEFALSSPEKPINLSNRTINEKSNDDNEIVILSDESCSSLSPSLFAPSNPVLNVSAISEKEDCLSYDAKREVSKSPRGKTAGLVRETGRKTNRLKSKKVTASKETNPSNVIKEMAVEENDNNAHLLDEIPLRLQECRVKLDSTGNYKQVSKEMLGKSKSDGHDFMGRTLSPKAQQKFNLIDRCLLWSLAPVLKQSVLRNTRVSKSCGAMTNSKKKKFSDNSSLVSDNKNSASPQIDGDHIETSKKKEVFIGVIPMKGDNILPIQPRKHFENIYLPLEQIGIQKKVTAVPTNEKNKKGNTKVAKKRNKCNNKVPDFSNKSKTNSETKTAQSGDNYDQIISSNASFDEEIQLNTRSSESTPQKRHSHTTVRPNINSRQTRFNTRSHQVTQPNNINSHAAIQLNINSPEASQCNSKNLKPQYCQSQGFVPSSYTQHHSNCNDAADVLPITQTMSTQPFTPALSSSFEEDEDWSCDDHLDFKKACRSGNSRCKYTVDTGTGHMSSSNSKGKGDTKYSNIITRSKKMI